MTRYLQYRVKSLRLGRVFTRHPIKLHFYTHIQVIMPRQPLREISANSNQRGGIRGRLELTPHWRSHIVGRAAGGQPPKAIADDLHITSTTIKSTLYRDESRYENESLHRSGRPGIVSNALRRRLLREVRAIPKIQYKDLRLNLGLHGKAVSKAILYRILKKEGIVNW